MPDTCLFCVWCRLHAGEHGQSRYMCERNGREIRSSDVLRTQCAAYERSR